MTSAYVAYALSVLHGTRFALDIRDFPRTTGSGSLPLLTKLVIRRADFVSSSSWSQVKYIQEVRRKNDAFLYLNGIAEDIASAEKKRTASSNHPLNLIHAGSLYGGHRPVAHAVQILSDSTKMVYQKTGRPAVLISVGDDSEIAKLNEQEHESFSITTLPRLSRSETLSLSSTADFNLILQGASREHRGAIPLKAFELIGTGRPIVYFGPRDSDTISLLREFCTAPYIICDPGACRDASASALADWMSTHIEAESRPATGPTSQAQAQQVLCELATRLGR